jgi:hypothetical protein
MDQTEIELAILSLAPGIEAIYDKNESVPGHIGFELRCAERIFISLNIQQFSDSLEPEQTVLRSQGNSAEKPRVVWPGSLGHTMLKVSTQGKSGLVMSDRAPADVRVASTTDR